jgi:hypothetical protein
MMEASMHGYEIRVVARDYKTSKSYQTQQIDTAAAIRRACALKPQGLGVEVWDGMDCIYANYRDQPFLAP